MRNTRIGALLASSALASATILGGAGIASAQEASPDNITFSATDNGDCTATFEVVNTTNSDWAEVHYWTGDDVPAEAPAFEQNEGAELAIAADAAFRDENGDWYAPYSETRGNTDIKQKTYVRGLEPVTTTADVDFSDEAAEDGVVSVGYRMTNPDTKDYDLSLKTLDVTGCGGGGFLGSLDVFGSLSS